MPRTRWTCKGRIMNRIAILVLILIVAALATLLVYRVETRTAAGLYPSQVRREPEAALQQVETLIRMARDGAAAADQARETLTTVIESDPTSLTALEARLRLVELEQALGNNEAAAYLILDTVRAHPGSEETPRLIFDLGLLFAGPLDRPDEAREAFERVVNLYPNHDLAPEAAIRLTRICLEIGTPDQADHISGLRKFSRSNPDHPLAEEALLLDIYNTDHQESDHE